MTQAAGVRLPGWGERQREVEPIDCEIVGSLPPSGFFSTLMTSAPMSASISVQVGPAITCVRSTTFNPESGPISVPSTGERAC